MIRNRQKWYGCSKEREKEMVCPREGKAQQSSIWSEKPKSTVKEGGS